jgi:homogentisate 1,2-dioxygenase
MYLTRGTVPPKRHTQFRQPDGTLYHEELFSTQGFSGASSLLYHVTAPTRALSYRLLPPLEIKESAPDVFRPHQLDTTRVARVGDAFSGRVPLVFNEREAVWFAAPTMPMDYFVRNVTSDELTLIVEGSGALLSPFGRLEFGSGDMVVVPRGTTVQWTFEDETAPRVLVFESADPIEIPGQLRAPTGQLLERAPFCERDLRCPEMQEPVTERGEYRLHLKSGRTLTEVILQGHPFDVVGWDGWLYPFALNTKDVEPITGSLHQMPDRYQIFGTAGAAICVIGPHKLAFHRVAIPTPPAHVNIDYDELVFSLSGTIVGRTGPGSQLFNFHPRGVHHGPNPGGAELSIGAEATDVTVFMIDVTRPLRLAADALEYDAPRYTDRWIN